MDDFFAIRFATKRMYIEGIVRESVNQAMMVATYGSKTCIRHIENLTHIDTSYYRL